MVKKGKPAVVLFEGDDYGRAPSHTPDGPHTVEDVMGFLTLTTDSGSDLIDDYTPVQLAYAKKYAEALNCEVQALFCDENGRVRDDVE
jgi:hypothetical protein